LGLLARLGLAFAFKGASGLGGVFNIRLSTSSSRDAAGDLDMWLNPAIRRHPEEAAIVGRLLLSYGELELMVAECLGNALFDRAIALQAIFSIMGESARINLADALMRSRYVMWKLEGEYGLAIGAMKQCIQIRNQYAHCTWGDAEGAGLFFTNLQDGSYSVRRF
jgi:hypothetical protein